MKLLWVGDPHAEPGDLPDCQALVDLILRVGKEQRPDVLVLAGDLYHTHAVIHAEVQWFWFQAFEKLREAFPRVIALKGNHDAPGSAVSNATALVAHKYQVDVVAWEPAPLFNCLFVPYASGDQVLEWSKKYEADAPGLLFCHQTFNGSVYENGFFAGDGLDPNLIKQKRVISGHIHTPQEFGKIWYPGAPRWRTLSDANVDRAIWVLEIDNGSLVKSTPIDTGTVCRQIFHFVDAASTPIHVKPDPRHEYRVDIVGSQAWIEERRPLFESWARVRTVRTDSKVEIQVKESDGVDVAFGKYLDAYKPVWTSLDVLKKLVKERINGF
jgi:DNA repair exonuclease SbcCD nuclease subunit